MLGFDIDHRPPFGDDVAAACFSAADSVKEAFNHQYMWCHNSRTLNGIGESAVMRLESIAPDYPLLQDLKEKSSAFDQAAAKYSPKVAS